MFYFFITKHHIHSSKLVQDRISKIRNLLPNVPNLIKFGGIANHNQQHEILKYFSSAEIPFKEKSKARYLVFTIQSKQREDSITPEYLRGASFTSILFWSSN